MSESNKELSLLEEIQFRDAEEIEHRLNMAAEEARATAIQRLVAVASTVILTPQ